MPISVWFNKKQGVYYLVDRDPRHKNGRKMTKLGGTEQDRIDGEAAAAIETEARKSERIAVRRREAALVPGQPIDGETALRRWWDVANGGYSANLRSMRRWIVFKHMVPYFADVDLRRLTLEHIATFAGHMARTPKRRGKGNLGWHSVRSSLIALRRLLRWLEGQEHLQFRNPIREGLMEVGMRAAEANGARMKKRQAWSRVEADHILGVAARRPDLHAVLYAALHTGMRKGELLALEWSDVDFTEGRIEVSKSRLRSGAVKSTKTGKERRVDLTDGLRAMLLELRMRNGVDSDCVFLNGSQPWNYLTIEGVWGRVRTAAHARHGVKRLPFHCFRHTFASWGLQAHADIAWLAMQLGHDTKVLLDVYAQWIPEERRPHFMNAIPAAVSKPSHSLPAESAA